MTLISDFIMHFLENVEIFVIQSKTNILTSTPNNIRDLHIEVRNQPKMKQTQP